MTRKEKNIEEIKNIIFNYNRNLTYNEINKLKDLRYVGLLKPIITYIECSNEDFIIELSFQKDCIRRIIYSKYNGKKYKNSCFIEEYYESEIKFFTRTHNLELLNLLINNFEYSDNINFHYSCCSQITNKNEFIYHLQNLKYESELINEKQELIDKISKMSLEDIKKIMK